MGNHFGARVLIGALCVMCATADSLLAQDPAPTPPSDRSAGARPQRVIVPGTDHEIVVGSAAFGPGGILKDSLLRAITHWLSASLALPLPDSLPQIALVPASKIAAFRQHGFPMRQTDSRAPDWIERREVVALYDDLTRTMYLRDDWTGSTPEELSVLVHEMAHHLQNLARLKFECPQQRERPAYEAQDRWLQLFGHDLAHDFGIDPFTLVAITGCFY